MTAPCSAPLRLDELLAYERGELSEPDEQRVEDHYFGCATCTRQLEELERLRLAVADLFRHGGVRAGTTLELVEHAAREGVRIRSYLLAPGEEVACTAAPDDDFVAIRLAGIPAGAGELDMEVTTRFAASGEQEQRQVEDVAIDRTAGEVIVLYPGDLIRGVPRSRWTMQLRDRRGGAPLGPYVLEHAPWQERQGS